MVLETRNDCRTLQRTAAFLRDRSSALNDASLVDRELSVGSTLTREDRWLVDPYHQMAAIADRAGENNGYRYEMEWTNNGTPTSPPAAGTEHTDIQLSGLQVGDSVLIGLRSYVAGQTAPTVLRAVNMHPDTGDPLYDGTAVAVTVLTTTGTIALLAPGAITATTGWADSQSGTLWIRIMIPAGSLANGHGDGLGQALRVTR